MVDDWYEISVFVDNGIVESVFKTWINSALERRLQVRRVPNFLPLIMFVASLVTTISHTNLACYFKT